MGSVERASSSALQHGQVAQAEEAALPTHAAEVEPWYDALTTLSDWIEAAPANPALRQQRAALLEQVEELKGIGAQEKAAKPIGGH